jgi:hypothetical protein
VDRDGIIRGMGVELTDKILEKLVPKLLGIPHR